MHTFVIFLSVLWPQSCFNLHWKTFISFFTFFLKTSLFHSLCLLPRLEGIAKGEPSMRYFITQRSVIICWQLLINSSLAGEWGVVLVNNSEIDCVWGSEKYDMNWYLVLMMFQHDMIERHQLSQFTNNFNINFTQFPFNTNFQYNMCTCLQNIFSWLIGAYACTVYRFRILNLRTLAANNILLFTWLFSIRVLSPETRETHNVWRFLAEKNRKLSQPFYHGLKWSEPENLWLLTFSGFVK